MRTSSSADVGICGVSLWRKTDAIWFYRATNEKKREKKQVKFEEWASDRMKNEKKLKNITANKVQRSI